MCILEQEAFSFENLITIIFATAIQLLSVSVNAHKKTTIFTLFKLKETK